MVGNVPSPHPRTGLLRNMRTVSRSMDRRMPPETSLRDSAEMLDTRLVSSLPPSQVSRLNRTIAKMPTPIAVLTPLSRLGMAHQHLPRQKAQHCVSAIQQRRRKCIVRIGAETKRDLHQNERSKCGDGKEKRVPAHDEFFIHPLLCKPGQEE